MNISYSAAGRLPIRSAPARLLLRWNCRSVSLISAGLFPVQVRILTSSKPKPIRSFLYWARESLMLSWTVELTMTSMIRLVMLVSESWFVVALIAGAVLTVLSADAATNMDGMMNVRTIRLATRIRAFFISEGL